MSGFEKVMHPIGAFGPKKGVLGAIHDPAGALARKVGGTAGAVISPSAALRGELDEDPPKRPTVLNNAAKTKKTTSTATSASLLSDEGKTGSGSGPTALLGGA